MKTWYALLLLMFAFVAQAGTIGNSVVSEPYTDNCVGCVFILGTPFPATDAGDVVTSWEFWADNTSTEITPLLFSFDGTNYTITGIGATEDVTSLGDQTDPFGLAAGSDIVTADTFFGWVDGSTSSFNAGTIAFNFDDGGGPPVVVYTGPMTPPITVGEDIGSGTSLARTYSVQATDSPAAGSVPEPGTFGCFLLGALGIGIRFRRNRQAQ